jgi:hypothetical protein
MVASIGNGTSPVITVPGEGSGAPVVLGPLVAGESAGESVGESVGAMLGVESVHPARAIIRTLTTMDVAARCMAPPGFVTG